MIRNSAAATLGLEAVVLNLGDLAAQAEMLKARARAEADQIVAAGRVERDRLIAGAAEEGRAQGIAEGVEQGRVEGAQAGHEAALAESRARLQALEAAWTTALAKFESERDVMLIDARQDVLRLAALMGELVTKRAVELEPRRVVDQVEAVLRLLVKPTRVTIAIHPDDGPLVGDALPALSAKYAAGAHVEVATDATLDRGSCIARTGAGGEIDASIQTQVQRIIETLLPAAPTAPEPPDVPPEAGT